MTGPRPSPPTEVSAALRRDLPHFLQRERALGFLPDLTLAHEVYDVGIRDIQEGRLLDAAKPTAWRFIITSPDGPPAAAEVAKGIRGREPYGVTHVNEGPFVEATLKAMERLGPDEAALRFLRVPAIYLYCLWRHRPGNDRLMPLPPAPRGLAPYELYPEEPVLKVAQEILSERQQRMTLADEDDIAP